MDMQRIQSRVKWHLLHHTRDKGTSKSDDKVFRPSVQPLIASSIGTRPLLFPLSRNRERFDLGQPLRPNFIIYNCVEMVPDVPNWFFSVCAFIGFVLCMIPLPWHLEAWNTGTCMFMLWTGVSCLIQFINSVVWNSDVINKAPVWCDICTQIMLASAVGIPASSLCINRRLYHIASVQSVTKTRAQKRHDIMVDLAIGLGIPLLQLAVHPVVQAHRFFIIEEAGCFPFTFNTPLAFPLVYAWPLAIGLVSAFYCVRTIRELALRRVQFKEFLSANRNLSSNRYLRLMGLAGVEMLFTIPLSIWSIYSNAVGSVVEPYVNWASAHADFDVIEQLPSVVWHQNSAFVAGLQTSRFNSTEARKNYQLAYTSVAKRIGVSTGSISSTGTWAANGTNPDASFSSGPATMPVYITHQTEKKRDSLGSFLSLADYGGALEDGKKDAFSPTTTSSGSISKESLSRTPIDLDDRPLPPLPEAALDPSMPPRYIPDAPRDV
ncbi:STE3-domain-containing protein [Chiua virens]|nr:STE3-domain-containing protein [Chiua virens]